MDVGNAGPTGGRLSEEARKLYERITSGGGILPGDGQALDELKAWRLIAEDPDSPGTPVPLDPQEAGRRRISAHLAKIQQDAADLAEIPSVMEDLSSAFAQSQWISGGRGSEFLAEPESANARILDALGQATEELLTAQPGGKRTPKSLQIARDRDIPALKRGVQIRSLYRATALDDPVTRDHVTLMTGLGGEFRTMPGPFQRVIIIDRRQAFISDRVSKVANSAAWHVTDRAVVAHLADGFEETWRRADVWHGERRAVVAASPEEQRTTRLQREILRDLSAGLAQRLTAKRLGISLRKVNGAVADLKQMWSADSPSELTYKWALSPDRLINDEPDAVGDTAA